MGSAIAYLPSRPRGGQAVYNSLDRYRGSGRVAGFPANYAAAPRRGGPVQRASLARAVGRYAAGLASGSIGALSAPFVVTQSLTSNLLALRSPRALEELGHRAVGSHSGYANPRYARVNQLTGKITYFGVAYDSASASVASPWWGPAFPQTNQDVQRATVYRHHFGWPVQTGFSVWRELFLSAPPKNTQPNYHPGVTYSVAPDGYALPNPQNSPTYRGAYRLDPEPEPSPLARYWRAVKYAPKNVPSVGLTVMPSGRVYYTRNPPRKRDGSGKMRMDPALAVVIGAVTEGMDLLEVLFRASWGYENFLSFSGRRGISFTDKVNYLLSGGLSSFDPVRFAVEFGKMQLEDLAFGKASRKAHATTKRAAERYGNPNRPFGVQTGPAM